MDERADDSSVSRGIGPLDDFGVDNDSIFINDFGINSRMCALMNSASAVEQDHADDFWVDNDSVFINNFGINNRMSALMNFVSAVVLDRVDNFWVSSNTIS